MAAPTPLEQLDTTLDSLQGGLIKITDAAHEDLAGWIKTLHGNKDLAPIATELQVLQDAITANHRGGIADSLSKLSEQTKGAAITATPDAQSKLFQLSDGLKLAAGQVG
ncbi:hypothetical protein E4631_20585 [Hymenobacter sp. UV11]|uniref:hypothetical protein n=1 Tax=Hymenobacter sp. UV11 TaxID=1849735 RepID=UPI00105E14DD|nr:hypothetical protein [Hymenobacter sp. UV11]TDN40060.1 hypothetical protein A8B98_15815 [Hymenobacter sp. UV11]TFZ64025.1 hypothetical protein E4631_20585 [Hymenobacter sp. UV11]